VVPPEGYLRGVAELCKKHDMQQQSHAAHLRWNTNSWSFFLYALHKSWLGFFCSFRVYVKQARCLHANMIISDQSHQTLFFSAKLFRVVVSSPLYLTGSNLMVLQYTPSLLSWQTKTLCSAFNQANMGVPMEGMLNFPFPYCTTSSYSFLPFLYPLGHAVAMTALSVLVDERLAEHSMRQGKYFCSAIHKLNSPLVAEVWGRGLLTRW
jgi:hypothetical protein